MIKIYPVKDFLHFAEEISDVESLLKNIPLEELFTPLSCLYLSKLFSIIANYRLYLRVYKTLSNSLHFKNRIQKELNFGAVYNSQCGLCHKAKQKSNQVSHLASIHLIFPSR